jgi:hypothetical protein
MWPRHLIAIACLVLASSSANAGILTLDPDTIMPGKGGQANPTVVVGNASISYALDAAMKPILPNGTATKGNDGYQIVDFTYTVTAKANPNTGMADKISIDWLTQEGFSSSQDSNITVAIKGNMSISISAGQMAGQVGGLIDSNFAPTVLFNFPPPPNGMMAIAGPANNVMVPWDKNGIKNDVAKGNNHTLNMVTSLSWNPAAVGDTLTIKGSYTVTASAEAAVPGGAPEPSTFMLAAIGATIAGLARFRSGRSRPITAATTAG